MPKFEVKDNTVNIWGLELEMQPVLKEAARLWESLGQTLVITCARDGMHSPGSWHYYGYAVDLRTFYFEDNGKYAAIRLKQILVAYSPYYDVILESTHIHVEYDPKKAGLL